MPAGGSKIRTIAVGDRFCNKSGYWYTVIEVYDHKNIIVRFDERAYEVTTTSACAKKGSIHLPKYFVGDVHQDKFGNPVTITKIEKDRVVLQWDDGYERDFQKSVLSTKTIMKASDSSTLNPIVQVGKQFRTNQGCTIEVKQIVAGGRCIVEFSEPFNFTKEVSKSNVVSGRVHNQHLPTLAGVGIMGDFPVNLRGKMYKTWAGMLKRVYRTKENQIPHYGDCSVWDGWHNIEGFAFWFEQQIVKDGWDLDKDLLVSGNKEYSPSTCLFLPREINSFLTDRRNHRGNFPVGVTFRKSVGNFEAACSIDGKRKYLGVYSTPEAAFLAYKKEKENRAKFLADKWRGIIDKKATVALENYVVNIDD